MNNFFKTCAIICLLSIVHSAPMLAQHGGMRMTPEEMAQREKQNLYKQLADLSADQKNLLDGIYEEFASTYSEMRDEVRKTRDWQSMRSKMAVIRKEKDDLIGDVLSDQQLLVYQKMNENRQNRNKKAPQDSVTVN